MKNTRKLIPAIAMLLVSAVMLTTASFAWFTMSSEAKATGMTVTATASSSLLITKTDGYDGFKNASGIIDFTNTTKALTPATRFAADTFVASITPDDPETDDDESATNYLTESASGLVTISDASTVTSATGAYDGFYTAVPVAENSVYYIDYTFYIGESGAATGKILNAYFDTAALQYTLHNALTIDVYVDASTQDTTAGVAYVDSVNLYEMNTATADNGTVKVAIADAIPAALVANTAGGIEFGDSIQVTLRVYFDGNLLDATTTDVTNDYFVRNGSATTEGASFFVDFKAEAAPATPSN